VKEPRSTSNRATAWARVVFAASAWDRAASSSNGMMVRLMTAMAHEARAMCAGVK
jgi:hypothetical protein